MNVSDYARQRLAEIVGSDHVVVDHLETLTISPSETKEVSGILSFAKDNNFTISPQGSGTKLDWGGRSAPRIYISLTRLNRLIEHPWQDLTCTAQAGCRWQTLQQSLARHGQFIALDPLFQDRATVGGILSTNDSGVLRHRYGSLRDLVIGMTLVLSDGTIAKTGGKVVKNVAGYDLCKLLTGSYGTLGVITEATFRLHPQPLHEQSFTIVASKASELASLLGSIRGSHLLTQAVQLRFNGQRFYLDVKLNSHPKANHKSILAQMVEREGLILEEAVEGTWAARQALFTSDSTILRASTLPTQICAYMDQLQLMQSAVEIQFVSQAIGLHYISLRGSSEKIEAIIHKIRADNIYSGNTVSVLQRGPGINLPAFDIPVPALSVMQSIKRQFDPYNILNPGKLFAGI